MHRKPLAIAVALIALGGGVQTAAAWMSSPSTVEPSAPGGERAYLVGFHELPDDRDTYQGEPVTFVDEDLAYLVVEADDPVGFQLDARTDDRVRYLEENDRTVEPSYEPNDPRFRDQYGPQITNTTPAWDVTLGSTAVLLGFTDSGIHADHEDLVNSRISGYDYVNGDATPEDDSGCHYHGTHVAGVAAATTDNDRGIAGMSQSSIVAHKIFDDGLLGCSSASNSQVAQAIKDLADEGVHVATHAWGGSDSTAIQDALDYAEAKGVHQVAPAGNDGPCLDCVQEPWASHRPTIVVACTDADDDVCSFSSQGPQVDIAAPGDSILSLDGATNESYSDVSGTSMSAPFVSGAIGLYIAAGGTHVIEDLFETADDIGYPDNQQGAGRLDTGEFVHRAVS